MRCECTGSYSFREVTVACKRYINSLYNCLSSGLVKTVSAGKVMSRKLSSSLRSFVLSLLRGFDSRATAQILCASVHLAH